MLILWTIKISKNYSLELVRVDGKIVSPARALAGEIFGILAAGLLEAVKFISIALFVLFLLVQFCGIGCAATVVPPKAEQYRAILTRAAHYTWGLDAPIALFAGQVHAESRWNKDAKSPVGAMGLAQFMPATAGWMPQIDASLAQPAPYNPGWALRALTSYDLWLFKRARGVNDFQKIAFALSGYNGGEGWVNRDRRLAEQKGLNPDRWFEHVETVNAGRSAANWRENRAYPHQIMREHQIAYERAGWGRAIANPEIQ